LFNIPIGKLRLVFCISVLQSYCSPICLGWSSAFVRLEPKRSYRHPRDGTVPDQESVLLHPPHLHTPLYPNGQSASILSPPRYATSIRIRTIQSSVRVVRLPSYNGPSQASSLQPAVGVPYHLRLTRPLTYSPTLRIRHYAYYACFVAFSPLPQHLFSPRHPLRCIGHTTSTSVDTRAFSRARNRRLDAGEPPSGRTPRALLLTFCLLSQATTKACMPCRAQLTDYRYYSG
jgi:hypothetical protein